MGEFRMPALGADMEAGTLVEWTRRPGDRVSRGDIIAVVDTDKGAIEIEVFEDGVLERTLVAPGERVPVGTVLAVIDGHGAPTPAAPAPDTRVRAAPGARRLAAEKGIDLATVTGTGPGGAIQIGDVERAIAGGPRAPVPSPQPAAPPATETPPPPVSARGADGHAAMRRAIAAAMAASKREIPHYYLTSTIDVSAALAWLTVANAERPVTERLLPVVLFVKAVALALRDVPELNGYWLDDGFRPGTGIHVGCAVALRGGGLVAPAIHDTDHKDVVTVMRDLRDVTARVRAGTLRSSELTASTITVTSLGDQGAEAVHGIIYPPQVALVGFGRVVCRPWVVSDRVEVRQTVTVTLAADHRASDGHRGGLLLAAIKRRLQEPSAL